MNEGLLGSSLLGLVLPSCLVWHRAACCPQFEAIPPAIFLEHDVEERAAHGRLGRKAIWDRLTYRTWTPRRVWLSGQERLVYGEPEWQHMPEHDVAELIGEEEMRSLPPEVPEQEDQPWSGVPPGL